MLLYLIRLFNKNCYRLNCSCLAINQFGEIMADMHAIYDCMEDFIRMCEQALKDRKLIDFIFNMKQNDLEYQKFIALNDKFERKLTIFDKMIYICK